MSVKQYSILTDDIEKKLEEADIYAANTSRRLSKEEVFDSILRAIADGQAPETVPPTVSKTQ